MSKQTEKKNVGLMKACENGNLEDALFFIKNGANIHYKDDDGWTSLYMASQNGHIKVVEMLIHKGANVNDTDNYGQSPLHVASESNNNTEVVNLLMKHSSTVSNNKGSPLHLVSRDALMIKVQNIFPSRDFSIEYKYYEYFGTYITIKTIDTQTCLVLVFHEDYIFIELLQKCGFTGSTMLNKVYDLAQTMPEIKHIELSDGSKIKICDADDIFLAVIKILTTGQSWYNSFGYFSQDHESEQKHNNAIINMKYDDFLNEVYGDEKEHNEEKKKGNKLYPVEPGITVKSHFNKIWTDITKKNGTAIEKCKWLARFIHKIENKSILKYSGMSLIKNIKREGKAKKSKSEKSKSEKSKSEKSKSEKSKSRKVNQGK